MPQTASSTHDESEQEHVIHKDKDLRIHGVTPEELAKRVLRGGAPRRPETAERKAG